MTLFRIFALVFITSAARLIADIAPGVIG